MKLSNIPVASIAFTSLSLDHLLKLTALDILRRRGALRFLFLWLLLEHLDFIFETGENQTDHWWSAVQSAASVHLLIKWTNLRFLAVELHAFRILGYLWSLDQAHLDLIGELWGRSSWHLKISELGVLSLKRFFMQLALGNVECVGSEQSIDFFLELHQFRRVKGLLKHLGGEDSKGLKEINIWTLVWLNLRLELDVRLVLFKGRLWKWGIKIDDPAVSIGHLGGFLI